MTSVLRTIGWMLVGFLGCTAAQAVPPNVLQTGYVLPGFGVADAAGEVHVSAVDLSLPGDPAPGVSGTLAFHDCRLTCNPFGDLTPEGEVGQSSHTVSLDLIEVADREGWGRKVFAIRFQDGRFPNRFYLALSGHPAIAPRLLVNSDLLRPIVPMSAAEEPELHPRGAFAQVLPLASGRTVPPEFDESLSAIDLSSNAFPAQQIPGYRTVHVEVKGIAGGNGHLVLNGNSMSFDAFGEMLGGTLVAYHPRHLRFAVEERPDPLEVGRKLYRLEPSAADGMPAIRDGLQFSLVVAPSALGPHRLIIRRDEELLYVVPLANRDHLRHLRILQTLVDPRERSAVTELHRTFHGNVHLVTTMGRVTTVNVRTAAAEPRELNPLAELSHVRSLFLTSREPMTAELMAFLPQLTQLEELWLAGAPVKQRVLDQLSKLPRLRMLTLKGNEWSATPPPRIKINKRGLEAIARVETLEHLGLMGVELDPKDLELLGDLATLKSLYFQETPVPLAALLKLGSSLPQLEFDTGTIMVSRASRTARLMGLNITDDELAQVATLPWIESLELMTCENITDASFSKLTSLVNLKELLVFDAKLVTDQGLLGLSALTKLRRLSLRHCAALTDRTVDELIGLENLEELDLTGTGVTPNGLELLRQELPKCKVLPE